MNQLDHELLTTSEAIASCSEEEMAHIRGMIKNILLQKNGMQCFVEFCKNTVKADLIIEETDALCSRVLAHYSSLRGRNRTKFKYAMEQVIYKARNS